MTRPENLYATAHVEAADLAQAHKAAAEVISLFGAHADIVRTRIEAYPKFDEHYAIHLDFRTALPWDAAERVIAAVGGTWLRNEADGLSAIWDSRVEAPGPVPAMRWIHLQVFAPNTRSILLGDDEALVLFDRLAAWAAAGGGQALELPEPAEVPAFDALLTSLENQLEEIGEPGYAERLASARERLGAQPPSIWAARGAK